MLQWQQLKNNKKRKDKDYDNYQFIWSFGSSSTRSSSTLRSHCKIRQSGA